MYPLAQSKVPAAISIQSLRWIAALASGGLLALAFPPLEWSQCAWAALLPLLLAVAGSAPRLAFQLGFATGGVFWFFNLAWLRRLFQTAEAPAPLLVVAWILLAAYCALYTGAFAYLWAWVFARVGKRGLGGSLAALLAAPVIWIGLEYLRGALGVYGFAWNGLGISQYRHLPLLQTARWTGVYGLSGIIVLLNAGLALSLLRHLPGCHLLKNAEDGAGATSRSGVLHVELWVGLAVLTGAVLLGMQVLRQALPEGRLWTVAAVQPAIPQAAKWDEVHIAWIVTSLDQLTREALRAQPRPDLILWPETTTPGPTTQEGVSRDCVLSLLTNGVPILVGAIDVRGGPGDQQRIFNSALLYVPDEGLVAWYDKQRLVPFGEFLPLESLFPILARWSPLDVSCTFGRTPTVFCETNQPPFAALICFEDTQSGLARTLVQRGARLLVNLTNDAWFDRTACPQQHLSHSVFRAVESGVPLIRAANSGVTALVDGRGAIHNPTVNRSGVPPEAAVRVWRFAVPPGDAPLTPYTRYGDWPLAIPCLAATLLLALLVWRQPRFFK